MDKFGSVYNYVAGKLEAIAGSVMCECMQLRESATYLLHGPVARAHVHTHITCTVPQL